MNGIFFIEKNLFFIKPTFHLINKNNFDLILLYKILSSK